MKLNEIFAHPQTKIFMATNFYEVADEADLLIEPTDFELLPDDANYYFAKAFQVFENSVADCYIGIITPERIAETVVLKKADGNISVESIYDQEQSVIPAVASDCFGDYELFYAEENPQIGIDVLKNGLAKAKNKEIVAEDLGYILRDEETV